MTQRSRPLVAYVDAVSSGRIAPADAARLAGYEVAQPEVTSGFGSSPEPCQGVDVLVGWMPSAPEWIDDPHLSGATIIGGYGLGGALADGRLDYLPVRLGSMPGFLASTARPDVVVVGAVRRGSGFAYRDAVGWGPAAVAAAAKVVVEVEEDPLNEAAGCSVVDLGGPMIDGEIDAVAVRPPAAVRPALARHYTEVEAAIGRAVANLLPDGATIQIGLGGVAEAVVAAISRPVGIRSGLLSEAAAELHRRGLLTGVAQAGYLWGDQAVVDLAAEGRLELCPVEFTHDITAMASTPRFVSCNTALQVGLDGSVNVERVNGRQLAAVGGHADFCAGASRCPDGLSIVALKSTTAKGVSTIVSAVEVVSTPRCDVEVVVTEHGVADLRGVGNRERAIRLIEVAAPEHRSALESASRP